MVDRTRHALTETENERIFRDRIVPDELVGTPQSRPVVVFVGRAITSWSPLDAAGDTPLSQQR